jgi:hypothetical protein
VTTVFFLHAGTLGYPSGGGYFWTRLNRALGLRSAGCRVIWMEGVDTAAPSAYETHSAPARGIAAEYFEAQRTAGRLLGSIGMG